MIIPDVNLLLYAIIDGYPQHERARGWLERAVNGPTQIGMTSPAIFGFLRISTNARVMESPLPVDDAVGYVRDWLARPNVYYLMSGPEHLDIALGLLKDAGTAGNLTTDVQLAAFAIEHNGELHSYDADFGRFAGLNWVNPLR